MPDVRGGHGEQPFAAGEICARERLVPRQRADAQPIGHLLDPGQCAERVDVDEMRRPHDAKGQERKQALPTGEELRFVARLRQQHQRVVERVGTRVGERRCPHRVETAFTIGP